MRVAAALLLALATFASAAEPRRIAITVDDLPWVEHGRTPDEVVHLRFRALVEALARFDTAAVGFVNEDKLERDGSVDPARVALLARWLDAGLDLGNHTHGHVGMHAVPIDEYLRAIERGDAVTRGLLAKRQRVPTFFRHPFLQAGRDDADRTRLAAFLAAHGYRVAPVTVDNGDWIWARAYVDALDAGDAALQRRLREDYVAYMDAKVAYYEQQSKRLFGREIAQVLLCHASALNADAMPALLARLVKRGYEFVPLDAALADPAYAHEDGYRGRAGISWMHRWAMAERKPRVFYEGEPVVPQWVLDLAGVESE
jgi:peptidoglycan/xylan/chitin deacetylase (PgdA/CDA1 family)